MDIAVVIAWFVASGALAFVAWQRNADALGVFMFSVFASPAVAGIELRRTMREGPSDVPARAVLTALVTGPLALMITQRVLLGRDASEILLLVAAGTAGATAIRLSPTLRDKTASELLSWVKVRPVAGQVALAALIVSEGIAAGRSAVRHAQHRGVAAALANKDACVAIAAWRALKPSDVDTATSADRDEATRLDGACNEQLATLATLEARRKAEEAAKEKVAADARSAKKTVDDVLKEFGAEASGTIEDRRKLYLALLKTIEKAKSTIDVSVYKGLPVAAAAPLFARLTQLDDDEAADAKSAPVIPPKPEHDPPKYTGAYQLSGQVRKCYKDGVALQSGSKFYFLSNGKCPDVDYLYGYVEDTGRTVNVEIGRDGREAEVVNISDKESAADDRAAHDKAVVAYETEYARKLKAYEDATNGKEAVIAALEKRRAARKVEREALWSSLDSLLKPLAVAAAAGADLSTVKLPTVALTRTTPTSAPVIGAAKGLDPAAPRATGTASPSPTADPSTPSPNVVEGKGGGSPTPPDPTVWKKSDEVYQ